MNKDIPFTFETIISSNFIMFLEENCCIQGNVVEE